VEEKIKKMIREQLGMFSDVQCSDNLDQLGVDSLDVLELTMCFEEDFMVSISDKEMISWKTVQDIINGLRVLKGDQ